MKTCLSEALTKLCVFSVFALGLVSLTSQTTHATEAPAVKAGETAGFRNMGDTSPVKAIEGAGFRNMGGADTAKPVAPENSGAPQTPIIHPPITFTGADTPGFIVPKPTTTGFVTPDTNAHELNPVISNTQHALPNTLWAPSPGMPLTLVTLDSARAGPNQTGGAPIGPFSNLTSAPDERIRAEIHALDLY